MSKLFITRGYPSSGKSTLARKMTESNDRLVRINRDDLRFTMFGAYSGLTPTQEDAVTIVQRSAVIELINDGWDVIVDDTNLNSRTSSMWLNVSHLTGAHFEVIDVTTPVEECARRDISRKEKGERSVGQDIVYFFGSRYPMPWPIVS